MRHTIGAWRDLLPESDREQYRRADWGRRMPPGRTPALLVVDMTRLMFDPEFHMAPETGAEAVWQGCIELVDFSRQQGWPVFWSLRSERRLPAQQGVRMMKYDASDEDPRGNEFKSPLSPGERDLLIYKPKPSAFFETPLRSQLTALGVDTLVLCGMSTSGCVRAAALDAYSCNFRVFLVEDATGDRSDFAHKANLSDIDMKYGTVLTQAELEGLFRGRGHRPTPSGDDVTFRALT